MSVRKRNWCEPCTRFLCWATKDPLKHFRDCGFYEAEEGKKCKHNKWDFCESREAWEDAIGDV